MTRGCRRVFAIVALGAGGCASHATSHGSATLPACIRAEATDHTSGVQQFTFDGDGDLTRIVELDNAGKDLARTSLAWSASEIVVSRGGAFPFVQRGVLGAHGELVDWTSGADRVQLRWDGAFTPATTPPAARFAFETYYHLVGSEPLLPLDTEQRGVWPRMRAFAFTGTVVLHRDGAPETEDTRASYEHGRQVELSIAGTHGRPRVTIKTTWRGDQPAEQTYSDGSAPRMFASTRGHITHLTGGPDVTFTYDNDGSLTHVRTDHGGGTVIEVDVSRCANR